MIELTNINSFYGASHALHDISLTCETGGITAVLGRNGVGKTTLLKTIMGLEVRHAGAIRLNNEDLSKAPTFRRARAGIGYVPQGRQIFSDFSVRENILMGGFARANGGKGVPDIVTELFPYLGDNMSRPGGLLSGGQQQQLAIARALASEPSVLLMDEPTEGIQPNIVHQIEDTIIRLNKDLGLTIILVEQNVDFARRACGSFAMLEKGRVVAAGASDMLTEDLVHRHMTV